MERIKVGEKDQFLVIDINRRIQASKGILDNSIPIVKALIGRFDTEVLSDVITVNNTRNELKTAMLDDIEKLSSLIMKSEFQNKLKSALNSYDEAVKSMLVAVNNISDIIPIQNWCVENDLALIKDYNKIIEEITSIYITGEKGIKLYTRLEDIVKELNSISDISRICNVIAVSNPPAQRGLITTDSKGVHSVNGVLVANIVKEVYK